MTKSKTSLRVGEAVLARLKTLGVEHVFGIPGVHNIELYRNLDSSGLTHILARHEQGAAFMADGYARASGKPAVIFVISGPGLCNAMTAIGQSYSDSVPTLTLASCLPSSDSPTGGCRLHEMKDQELAGRTVADWSETARSPDHLFRLLDRAFFEFSSVRPRPKIINIPIELLETYTRFEDSSFPLISEAPRAGSVTISRVLSLLRGARKPLFIFGGGSVSASSEATRLVKRCGAAVFSTYAGAGTVPCSYPLNFGSTLAREESAGVIGAADLVIAVGTELSETDLWRPRLGHTAPLIRIDLDPTILGAAISGQIPIFADCKCLLGDLLNALPWRSRITSWDPEFVRRYRKEARKTIDGLRPGLLPLVDAFWAALPRNTTIYTDMTQFAYLGKEAIPREVPGQWHHPYGFGTLGYALPAAIGGKIAMGNDPVIAVAGDYGLQYTVQELATAAELSLPLPIVVWDNSGMQEIVDSMNQVQIRPHAVSPRNPDFVALAEAYGANASRPVSLDEFSGSILQAFRSDKPTVVVATPECL